VDRAELYRRIDARSEAMVREGLLAELRGLRERGYPPDLRAFNAIGYKEAGDCLDGRLADADLGAEVARATRRYAKRQLVWLRNQGDRARHFEVAFDDVDAARDVAMRLFGHVATRHGNG